MARRAPVAMAISAWSARGVRAVVATLGALGALGTLGCTTLVETPPAPRDPVAVVLLDWGWHSSLLLPRPDAGFTEFTFGEWEWFALRNDRWWRVPAVLLWPRDAALARREWDTATSHAALAEVSHVFLVERTAAEDLRSRLEAQFAAGAAARVVHGADGLDFVPAEQSFWIGQTCNGATADWLAALECQVSGPTVAARYEVEGAEAR